MPERPNDLREWLALLRAEGELVVVAEPVRAEPDIGAIGRAICDGEGPGVLCEQVAGFRHRVATGLHASFRRTALAMGLPKTAGKQDQMAAWAAARRRYPVEPVVAASGPCKEVVAAGSDVNLFQFPIHRINQQDGSFYLSKPLVVSRDTETGQVNVGMYRMMVLDRNRAAIMFGPHQDMAVHYAQYLKMGRPMPISVVLGSEPVLPMVAGMKIARGWDEYAFAGAVRGQPLTLTQSETSDLPVPAGSEIVLEGTLSTERTFEGPFGEFPGAYTGTFKVPVLHIHTITHRHDAIYEALYIGRPQAENHYMTLLSKLAGAYAELKPRYPNITQLAFLRPYVQTLVIQARWRHSGEPRRMMCAWWGGGLSSTKFVVCVDEDVDPWNEAEVIWAIATRCQADRDLVIIPHGEGLLDPSQHVANSSCKFGIDATKPRAPHWRHPSVEWIQPRPETAAWGARLQELARDLKGASS